MKKILVAYNDASEIIDALSKVGYSATSTQDIRNLTKIVEKEEPDILIIDAKDTYFKNMLDMQMETIFSLAKLAQSRDDDTGRHLERVQQYCFVLAKALAENSVYSNLIDENFINNIVNAIVYGTIKLIASVIVITSFFLLLYICKKPIKITK